MIDFGTQTYFGNALLIAWSQQDTAAFRRLFATAMGIYVAILAVTAVGVGGVTALMSWPDLLGTRVMSEHGAATTFLLLVTATAGLIPLGLFTALYRVHGDYVHGTVYYVIADAARGFGVCLVAFLGGGVVTAGWVYLAIAGFYWGLVLVDLRRRFGALPFGVEIPSLAELRTSFSRSALYFVPWAVNPIVQNAPILLLGRLDTVSGAVVAFTVGRTFTGFVRQVVVQICFPMGFEMARQSAISEFNKLRRIFLAGSRLTSGLAGILSGLTLAVADSFLRIWTHGSVSYDPWLVGAFLLDIVLMAPAQVAMVLYLSNNRPGVLVIAHGACSIGTVVFCSLLIKGFSATGAAIGTGLAEFLSVGILLPYKAARHISVPLGWYFGRCYSVAACSFAASWGVAWGLARVIPTDSLIGLIGVGAAWSVSIALPSYFLLAAGAERAWLRHLGGIYFRRLAKVLKISAQGETR